MAGEPLPETRLLDLLADDRLLLCSDGLTSMVADEQIGGVLREQSDLDRACEQLIELADSAGGRDNITTLLLESV